MAVHPKEPDTAWLVPGISDEKRIPVEGKVVVSRTRDGGRFFEVLRQGLPQDHAYDLTFRHAMDIDESGNRLAFGSTTGPLWVTENQGTRGSAFRRTCLRYIACDSMLDEHPAPVLKAPVAGQSSVTLRPR